MIVTNRYVYIIDTDTEIAKTLLVTVDFNSVAMETYGCLHFIWLLGKRFSQSLAVIPVCLGVENACESLFFGITERFFVAGEQMQSYPLFSVISVNIFHLTAKSAKTSHLFLKNVL